MHLIDSFVIECWSAVPCKKPWKVPRRAALSRPQLCFGRVAIYQVQNQLTEHVLDLSKLGLVRVQCRVKAILQGSSSSAQRNCHFERLLIPFTPHLPRPTIVNQTGSLDQNCFLCRSLPLFKHSTAPLSPCIIQCTTSSRATPLNRVKMTASNAQPSYLTPNSKHGGAKKWIQRQLQRAKSRPNLQSDDEGRDTRKDLDTEHPPTKSPATAVPDLNTSNPPLSIPITIVRDFSPMVQPPPNPAPRDPSVVKNVTAWLDASLSTPSPPLMGGLTYWRAATTADAKDSAELQHAIPIVQEPKASVSALPHGQKIKSFRRRAKKLQVQMPALLQAKSQRLRGRKQVYRQSASMPLLAVSYEAAQPGEAPMFMARCRSLLRPALRPSTANASFQARGMQPVCQDCLEGRCTRHSNPLSPRFGEGSGSIEQLFNAMSLSTRRGDSSRAPTVTSSLIREDSMGNLSDAPTYFTGLPPPSYQSRTASILSISSFGCVDGMNAEHRQLSYQRAARERGMRGRLRRLAGNFST